MSSEIIRYHVEILVNGKPYAIDVEATSKDEAYTFALEQIEPGLSDSQSVYIPSYTITEIEEG